MARETDLFRGSARHGAVRIPAVAVSGATTVIAMAVGRRFISDFGPSNILSRRSDDGGQTWGPLRVVQRGWWRTVDNPTLVSDPFTSVVHLFFQEGYRRLWHRTSSDGGRTFGRAIERTAVVLAAAGADFPIDGLAPGPGTGAVLESGRLVVPVWISHRPGKGRSAVMTIFSDDRGATWHAGDLVAASDEGFAGTSEGVVTADPRGGAVMSFRQRAVPSRVFSWSSDGATGWSDPRAAPEIGEPVCQAGLTIVRARGVSQLAFTNPDSRSVSAGGRLSPREKLTLRRSEDGGKSWTSAQLLDPGPSGYSALASDSTGGLHVMWEHGRRARTKFWPATIRYTYLAPSTQSSDERRGASSL